MAGKRLSLPAVVSEPTPIFIRDLRVIVSALTPFVIIMYFVIKLTIQNSVNEVRIEFQKNYATRDAVTALVPRAEHEQKWLEDTRRFTELETKVQRLDDKVATLTSLAVIGSNNKK